MPPKCSFFSLESEETGCGETSVKKGKYPFAIDFDFEIFSVVLICSPDC